MTIRKLHQTLGVAIYSGSTKTIMDEQSLLDSLPHAGAAATACPALATGTNPTLLRAGQSVARIPAREASRKEESELSTEGEDTRRHEKR